MSDRKRIPTDAGAGSFGTNPFAGLSIEGLPDAPSIPPTEEVTGRRAPNRNRGTCSSRGAKAR